MAEIWLQVVDEQQRRARRGYDGRIVRVESQLDVVWGFGHFFDIETEEDRGDQPTLCLFRPHTTTWCRGRQGGRLERPTRKVWWNDVDKVRREIKDGQLVKETFDPNGIEGFVHVQEHCACHYPLAEIPGYSFNEAGQQLGRAMLGSKPTVRPSATNARLIHIRSR